MFKDQWATGSEIMDRWQIKDYELLGLVRQGLRPYSPTALHPYRILNWFPRISCKGVLPGSISMVGPPHDINNLVVSFIEDLLPYIKSCIFRQDEVDAFEKDTINRKSKKQALDSKPLKNSTKKKIGKGRFNKTITGGKR
jgi:hypothetical protein